MYKKVCVTAFLFLLASSGLCTADGGLGDLLRKIAKWGKERITRAEARVDRLVSRKERPLTECHGRHSTRRGTDTRAPIITAPQAFHIAANNSVWLMTRTTSRLQVQMFLKRNGVIIEDSANCHSVILGGTGRAADPGTQKVDLFLKPEFLPPGHIPGTATGLYLSVRWRHDSGAWYEDQMRLKTTVSDRIFIQTDKPVYRPQQTVTMRIYMVRRTLTPMAGNVNVYITSPDGVVYQKDSLTPSDSPNGIQGLYQLTFDFPIAAKHGLWKITVKYGHGLVMEEKAAFELQEYTLPSFSVQVSMPEVIQNSRDAQIPIQVTVRHVFGEKEAVHGSVECYAAVSKNGIYPPSFYKWPSGDEPLCIGPEGTVNLTLDMDNYNALEMFGLEGEQLLVYCNASEYFTDDRASGKAQAVFAAKMYSVDFQRSPSYFKSGLPYVFQADVTLLQSKTAAKNVEFSLEVAELDSQRRLSLQNTTSDDNGQIMVLLRDLPNEPLFIKLTPRSFGSATYIHKLFPQQGQAITIIPQLVAGQDIEEVTIVASDFNAINALYFIGLSNGNILAQYVKHFGRDEIFPREGYTLRNLRMMGNMIPHVDLVVFYFDSASQPVVDTLRMVIHSECNDNERISTDKAVYAPAEEMLLTYHGFHDTGVAPLMVDNAALLLGKHGTISQQTITDSMSVKYSKCTALNSRQRLGQLGLEMMGLDMTQDCTELRKRRSSSHRVQSLGVGENCCEWARSQSRSNERMTCNNMIGALLLDEGSRVDQNCITEIFHCCKEYKKLMEAGRKASQAADRPVFERQVQEKRNEDGNDVAGSTRNGEQINDILPAEMIRKSFPESIVLPVAKIGNEHKYDQRQRIPDSITSWNIQAVYLNPTSGMCVPQAKDIDVIQAVFIRVSMPYKVVRGEHVKMSVVIHNTLDELILADITLDHIDDGLCYNNATALHSVRIAAGSREYRHWFFVARDVGWHTITISARNSFNRSILYDSMQQTVLIQHKGIKRTEKQESVLLGNRPPGFTHRVAISQPNDTLAVANSTKVFVKLSAHVMGPSVGVLLDQVKTTKRKSASCVIRRLSSTLYAAMYLKKTNNLQQSAVKKIKKQLRKGATDLLSFKSSNGSFANSEQDEPSVWLTASALKLMNEIEREFPRYTEISDALICQASQWLMDKQDGSGGFEEQSAGSPRKQARWKTALTSYVSVALDDLQCSESAVKERGAGVVRQALHFIHTAPFHTADTYSKVHVAAALARHQHTSAGTHYRHVSRLVHEITEQHVQQIKSRHVEIVSHALMTSVTLAHAADSSHFAQWLLKARNQDGEFILSQDTASALEALAHYAAQQRVASQPSACAVAAALAANDPPDYNVTLDPLRTEHIDVTDLGETLELSCAGDSAVHAEVFYEYHTLQDTRSCFVTMETTVQTMRRPRRRGKRSSPQCGEPYTSSGTEMKNITLCFDYTTSIDILSMETELNLLSGHVPVESSLDTARDLDHIHNIEYNHDRSALILRLSLTQNQKRCMSFKTKVSGMINNIQPARIVAQDEETGLLCSVLYHTDDKHPMTAGDHCSK